MTRVRLKGINKVGRHLADGTVRRLHYARATGKCFWRSDSEVKEGSPAYLDA